MDERALRAAEAVRAAGAGWAVLTAPASVSYATGHDEPAGAGRSPFAGGPAVAIVSLVLIAWLVSNSTGRQARDAAIAALVGLVIYGTSRVRGR